MPESPSRPPRGPVPLCLALTLALSALAPLAGARPESPEGVAALLGVPTPAEGLRAALPGVHLTRAPEPPSLLVVTAQPAASVAARYGVARSAVDALPRSEGESARVLRVRLPVPAPDRPPQIPASIATHTALPGETLAGIAADAGLSLIELLSANLGRSSLDDLEPGEALFLPTAERGLLVRIKPGQTALSLIAGYGADLTRTARANGVLPTALGVGDYLLLPGVRAGGLYDRLVERRAAREEEERRERRARMQARYDRYLAWQQERERARLQERYAMQEKYEAYLAWQQSPERQRLIEAYGRQAQYEAAQAALRERQARAARSPSVRSAGVNVAAAGGLAWPVRDARVTSRYGEADIDYHKQVFHGGVDLAAPAGTPVYAAADGTVTESGYGAYGMNVYTAQGDSTLVYGHLSRTAVRAGQLVRRGDLLGEVGCTGICTGPHLHFEVRLGGRAVDPLALLP